MVVINNKTLASDPHAEFSALRENILEHVFLGEIGRELWCRGHFDMEFIRAETDTAGYDIIVSVGGITRHIQLKGKTTGGRASSWSILDRLAEKPSGCVVVIYVNREDLSATNYRFFGGAPGEPMPSMGDAKRAKHNKGDSKGFKENRKHHRLLHESRCSIVPDIRNLVDQLFGKFS